MVAEIHDILKEAVLEKSALHLTAILGAKSAHAAKALQWSEAPGPEGFWVHLPEEGESTVARFGTALPPVSVSFAVNQSRYAFDSAVLSRNRRFWVNDSVMFDALLIAAPTELRKLEERRRPRLPCRRAAASARSSSGWTRPKPLALPRRGRR